MTEQMQSFSIIDMLATNKVRSATDLLAFMKSRPNEFMTKRMLVTQHGFSSNVGKNLTSLLTTNPNLPNKLWVMSSEDISNPKNKKQQKFYAYIDQSKLNKTTITALLDRCMMGKLDAKKSKKSGK